MINDTHIFSSNFDGEMQMPVLVLSGSKMARRIGSIEEFKFKTIGDNHNQGVNYPIFIFLYFPLGLRKLLFCIPVHELGCLIFLC